MILQLYFNWFYSYSSKRFLLYANILKHIWPYTSNAQEFRRSISRFEDSFWNELYKDSQLQCRKSQYCWKVKIYVTSTLTRSSSLKRRKKLNKKVNKWTRKASEQESWGEFYLLIKQMIVLLKYGLWSRGIILA